MEGEGPTQRRHQSRQAVQSEVTMRTAVCWCWRGSGPRVARGHMRCSLQVEAHRLHPNKCSFCGSLAGEN